MWAGAACAVACAAAALIAGCVSAPSASSASSASGPGSGLGPEQAADLRWLQRLTFGVDSEVLQRYRALGREGFLDEQLRGTGELPAPVAAQVAALDISRESGAELLAAARAESRRINALPEGADRQAARKALNERGNALADQARRRELLRALYSPAQLREQMTWFWLNHFSVYEYKAQVRWTLGDYAETIRAHALGRFRDLVMATLTHPAMLQYLDNAQNAAGHLNENYARELMELHILGVNGGYSQQDVQELARILTGVGIAPPGPPRLKPRWRGLYVRDGGFEFNPARHDFGSKVLLGHRVEGRGFAEVSQAVDILVHQDACARFISRGLAEYFVADSPPPALVERMAARFRDSGGDIAAVLRTMFEAPELTAQLGHKFKDPMQYVVSSLRLAYDGRTLTNLRPVTGWLAALGEAPFGHPTPDGYALDESAWSSSGQISRRFEIARAIGAGSAGLFEPQDGAPARDGAPVPVGFPQLTTPVYYGALQPQLSAATRAALLRARTQQEWNLFLLASPEFNYR
ncbi:MAG TPA: DUF1800 domain-containing protein [Steroidobacteraceae bacterium]|nr:DUF1800 domain-containing protein [Steroidobacteraceae bacterium]